MKKNKDVDQDVVGRLIKVLGDCFDRLKAGRLDAEKEIYIPFFGPTGSGKSSLINAVLAQTLTPTDGYGPTVTNVPVYIKHISRERRMMLTAQGRETYSFRAVIRFMSRKAFKTELENMQTKFTEENWHDHGDRVETELGPGEDKIWLAYSGTAINRDNIVATITAKTADEMLQLLPFPSILGQERHIIASDEGELVRELEKEIKCVTRITRDFLSDSPLLPQNIAASEEDRISSILGENSDDSSDGDESDLGLRGHWPQKAEAREPISWPLIKRVTVYSPSEMLEGPVTFIDVPDSLEERQGRGVSRLEMLKNASAMIFVDSAVPHGANDVLANIFKQIWDIWYSEIDRMLLVVTKSDHIHTEQIISRRKKEQSSKIAQMAQINKTEEDFFAEVEKSIAKAKETVKHLGEEKAAAPAIAKQLKKAQRCWYTRVNGIVKGKTMYAPVWDPVTSSWTRKGERDSTPLTKAQATTAYNAAKQATIDHGQSVRDLEPKLSEANRKLEKAKENQKVTERQAVDSLRNDQAERYLRKARDSLREVVKIEARDLKRSLTVRGFEPAGFATNAYHHNVHLAEGGAESDGDLGVLALKECVTRKITKVQIERYNVMSDELESAFLGLDILLPNNVVPFIKTGHDNFIEEKIKSALNERGRNDQRVQMAYPYLREVREMVINAVIGNDAEGYESEEDLDSDSDSDSDDDEETYDGREAGEWTTTKRPRQP